MSTTATTFGTIIEHQQRLLGFDSTPFPEADYAEPILYTVYISPFKLCDLQLPNLAR